MEVVLTLDCQTDPTIEEWLSSICIEAPRTNYSVQGKELLTLLLPCFSGAFLRSYHSNKLTWEKDSICSSSAIQWVYFQRVWDLANSASAVDGKESIWADFFSSPDSIVCPKRECYLEHLLVNWKLETVFPPILCFLTIKDLFLPGQVSANWPVSVVDCSLYSEE